MAGSEDFARTRSVRRRRPRPRPTERPVHVAIIYAEDGTIRLYRDGQPYGTPYNVGRPGHLPGRARRRSSSACGTRRPAATGCSPGRSSARRLYDRALDPAEVAASAATVGDYVDPAAIAAALPAERRTERARLLAEIEAAPDGDRRRGPARPTP